MCCTWSNGQANKKYDSIKLWYVVIATIFHYPLLVFFYLRNGIGRRVSQPSQLGYPVSDSRVGHKMQKMEDIARGELLIYAAQTVHRRDKLQCSSIVDGWWSWLLDAVEWKMRHGGSYTLNYQLQCCAHVVIILYIYPYARYYPSAVAENRRRRRRSSSQ